MTKHHEQAISELWRALSKRNPHHPGLVNPTDRELIELATQAITSDNEAGTPGPVTLDISPLLLQIADENLRRFHLERDADETGVSGTGKVAEGVVWSSGKVSISWLTDVSSVAVYDSLDDARTIHGHNGQTRFVFPA